MLSDRRQRVLAALIEEYVARALPVGSRTLTERYALGVSPATVRNELSALEEEGYISQPHTSAGRVPTDFGYRTFVDGLIADGLVAAGDEYRRTVAELRSCATELDGLMERTSAALARMTDCLSIVLAPSVLSLSIRQITLVSLTDTSVLLVLVTEDAQVLNRHMEFTAPISPDDLSLVQRYLNQVLTGATLAELEGGLQSALRQSLADPLVRAVLDEVVACLRQGQQSAAHQHAHRVGMRGLMAQPEFSRSAALLPLVQVLEDDTVLMRILGDASSADMPTVTIGRENRAEGLEGVSVVASRYGRGESAGVVAVIGPTRMDYSRVINAVRVASSALGDDPDGGADVSPPGSDQAQ
ncbi:MAG: heat-inducible transcriptional repressor HrcA [Coriobacteriia bacterium]|nr:heat-inducible transcriptional repressor HrcA [Coriobacteriia bacterium]